MLPALDVKILETTSTLRALTLSPTSHPATMFGMDFDQPATIAIQPIVVASSPRLHPFTITHYKSEQNLSCSNFPCKLAQPPHTSDHSDESVSTSSSGSTTPAQSAHHPDTETRATALESTRLELAKRSISSTSLTHNQLAKYRPELEKAAQQHARVLSERPENLMLPGTNKRRFTFETYQMQLPTTVLVQQLEYERTSRRHLAQLAAWWSDSTVSHRVAKRVGLREWEWTAGEPQNTGSADWVNESTEHVIDSRRKDRADEEGVTEAKESYAARKAKFTYTRADDPVFKGRKIVLSRSRQLVAVCGDFADEVDDEEYEADSDSKTDGESNEKERGQDTGARDVDQRNGGRNLDGGQDQMQESGIGAGDSLLGSGSQRTVQRTIS